MPTCSYCNKNFKDHQALGNHIRKHQYDSDDDLPSQNQPVYQDPINLIDTTTQNLCDSTNKKIKVDYKMNVEENVINDQGSSSIVRSLVSDIESTKESLIFDEDFAVSDEERFVSTSDEELIVSDNESVASDLSYRTDVNVEEYVEYDAMFNEIPSDFSDIFQEFPSEEYAEFMYMVTRFRVQDPLANAIIRFFNKYSKRNNKPLPSTFQARRVFMENLQLPNFGWRKETIFEYKEKEYNFEYRTVLDGIQQILINKTMTEDFIFEYKLSIENDSNERQYTDIPDSNWWKNVEQEIPIGAHAMPIILYADATLCDHLGKTSRHPIFMTLGNIPLAHRNKTDAKILLGYIPSLESYNVSEKQSTQYRIAARKLFHCALATILKPLRILSNNGIHLYVNGSLKWFYPLLALIISDWPEAYTMCSVYESSNSLYPCHFCLVDRNEMNNVHIKEEDIKIRNENDTKDALRHGNAKQISAYNIRNALWKRP
ncbi:unnamed protein product [Rhizophagus irregularis]|nr:unnamed protein product [Rhizophagus irregularis]